MPYVTEAQRRALVDRAPKDPGELNYEITRLIDEYVRVHGRGYRVFNDAIGALEAAKLEFYRRVVAPYEDAKIETNGDVYTS